ncbi:putative oxidoreductase [Sphingobacterium nematocida]|uniref:Putative oxidoreductase n=1 Tax=Sphingobacterium nematocida TaxID=1513896 RepID=A0A1T5E933_9SPHI|nr:DoxX family protein [Sphingobacterium nematocida]SKB80329.1 putative oxidoreductase [Sphingobacterium nematocida]
MSTVNTKKDIALLILRVTIGLTMLIFHGLPKLMGGPEKWKKIGLSMGNLGIDFLPSVWGFSASIVESLCALFIVLGLWTRPNSILLAFTMLIATISHLTAGDGFNVASHAIELMAVFIALFLTGPGKYSVDKR